MKNKLNVEQVKRDTIMKKIMFTLIALLGLAVQAQAMSYEQAREEALFLTDKMAYELNLTDAQYEAAYEINLDYLMGVTSRHDVFGSYWERRNADLRFILYSWQWDMFRAATYFFRPLYWDAGYWHFGIYARYPHRDYFYFGRPHFYASYRGGHSWRMNGDRSYYEHHREHFRPSAHRDNHFGMRDGWNRGDYRGGRSSSSTRVTGRNGNQHYNNGRVGNGRVGNGRVGNGRVGDGRVGDGRVGDGRVGDGRVGNGRQDNRTNDSGTGMQQRGNSSPRMGNARTSYGATRSSSSGATRSDSYGTPRSASGVTRSSSGVTRSSSGVTRSSSGGSRSSASSGRSSNNGSRSGGRR